MDCWSAPASTTHARIVGMVCSDAKFSASKSNGPSVGGGRLLRGRRTPGTAFELSIFVTAYSSGATSSVFDHSDSNNDLTSIRLQFDSD